MAAPPPFACQYQPQFAELLHRLGCTLALSTYQAGKLIFLSATGPDKLVQLPRTFDKVMGIAAHPDGRGLALACRHEIVVFARHDELARTYPKAPGRYDALYLPRLSYHTGPLDVHDLHYGADGRLYAVNTLFSCLMTLGDRHNFVPYWRPEFITALAPEDRCHLNGLALENGVPRYATAFGTGDTPKSWRARVTETGVVFDVTTNDVLATGLAMPHTPRLYDGALYVLLSARGELVRIDRSTGAVKTVVRPGGFLRGMARVGDYLFIARSKLRRGSSTFAQLDLPAATNRASIVAVHLPTAAIAGEITWLSSLDEIYDLHALPGVHRPNILSTRTEDHRLALTTPENSFWARPTKAGD